MKTNLKQKFLRTVMGGMGALMLLSTPHAFAIFPTSGTCAMLVTPPVPAGAVVPLYDTYNVLAMLTFTGAAGTIDFSAVGVEYNGGGAPHYPPFDELGSAPLAITAGLLPSADSKTLSFYRIVGDPGSLITINAFSVNGGRTILIQGANGPFSGVCQFL